MVLQGGWFISPHGEIHEVLEHLAFVKEYPALFGLAKERTSKWTRKDRGHALRLVLRRGWIRVRDGTFETWNLTATAVRNIKGFLKQIKAWPQDPIRVTELSRRTEIVEPVAAFEEGQILAYARNTKRCMRKRRR